MDQKRTTKVSKRTQRGPKKYKPYFKSIFGPFFGQIIVHHETNAVGNFLIPKEPLKVGLTRYRLTNYS